MSRPQWSPAERFAFRFAFVYLIVYNLPLFAFVLKPGDYPSLDWFDALWRVVTPWVGVHLFRFDPARVVPGGSETVFDYVRQLCIIGASLLIALAWSVVDRKRKEYERLYDWLRIFVRYALATIMMTYGSQKVIKTQFPFPRLDVLAAPFGQMAPNELLWNFMGHSVAYTLFTGLGETIGGLLLFFRRTTTAGALLLVAVMSNVVLLNFAYDVPVKLYSTFLLLMALFLLIPERTRLANVLLWNKPTAPIGAEPPLNAGPWRFARLVAKACVICVVTIPPFRLAWRLSHTLGDYAPSVPLTGVYNVTMFVRGRDTLPPLLTDTLRWRQVVISRPGRLAVRMMTDSIRRYPMRVDTAAMRFTLASRRDTATLGAFGYKVLDAKGLEIDGVLHGDSIHARLRRIDQEYRLLRPFHLVKEPGFWER